MDEAHTSHKQVLNRLKRAHGHMHKIMDMLENGHSCVDVAQQLYAVEKAVVQAKRVLIHDHIDHCLGKSDGAENNSDALSEFKEITKYL
ncbi:metal-sensing transcriptional repressor [Kiloniella antarctica]|uniref:Metal-sensing transcriptional repressor n=1 Tax=Kiloniella antarctica TaxID=1550907 RepID=A0ABW5BIM2_9PROT